VNSTEVERRLGRLSQHQLAVLSCRCEGLSVRETADRLGYSEQRIYQHLAVVYEALDMADLNGYGRRAVLSETVCPVWTRLQVGQPVAEPPPAAPAESTRREKMKGVILAGGTGSRLSPLTRVTNKHLLPVYDKPMVFYPIEALVSAGIDEVMVVTGGTHAGEFLRLLGNGHEFGLSRLQFSYQERPGGIAEALGLCEKFVGDDKVVVMLADNILGEQVGPYVENFRRQERGARILLKEVDDPRHLRHLGVPILGEDARVQFIREKPEAPPSPYAVIGVYMYDPDVFGIVRTLRPSARGELEITDVNNAYVDRGLMEYDVIAGFWGDCGESIDVYYQVVDEVRRNGANRASGERETVAAER
jgi:glucose-1-phosphate thymidylyltransferase